MDPKKIREHDLLMLLLKLGSAMDRWQNSSGIDDERHHLDVLQVAAEDFAKAIRRFRKQQEI